jgi:hypothetical protein
MITWSGDIDKLVINVRAGGHRHHGTVANESGTNASLIKRQTDHHGATYFHHDGYDEDRTFDHFDPFCDRRADRSHEHDEQGPITHMSYSTIEERAVLARNNRSLLRTHLLAGISIHTARRAKWTQGIRLIGFNPMEMFMPSRQLKEKAKMI